MSLEIESLTSSQNVAMLLAFADQGSNLAGKFFQGSLLPYLGFLLFLKNNGKQTPAMSFFGFQFLLLFVLATIPTGIISKSIYGQSLADVDWLHGAAEALLTVTNLLIVSGFRDATASGDATRDNSILRGAAIATAAAVAVFAAIGQPILGLEAHTPFLAGIGNLPAGMLSGLGLHAEPVNALSVPTWAIHFSSVFEWIFAMGAVWKYAEVSGNPAWRGLTWGMLPLHASGVAACTYHFFYNSPDLSFLVALQAGLTLMGNATVAIAALRIALATGWKPSLQNPFQAKDASAAAAGGEDSDAAAAAPALRAAKEEGPSDAALLGKLGLMTLVSAYAVKYGELALGLPFEPNAAAAVAMVALPPALLAAFYAKASADAPAAPASGN